MDLATGDEAPGWPVTGVFDPDNAQSVGFVMTYGRFRTIDLGDLTWSQEGELMCPANRIGTVDLYLVSHHGINQSNSAALVHGVQPRVAEDGSKFVERMCRIGILCVTVSAFRRDGARGKML